MSAPRYDWLANLSPVQRKYLNDNYKSFWNDYQSYGYSVVSYDYAKQIDMIYDSVMSQRIVETTPLPDGLKQSIQQFHEVQMRAHDLKYIVTPVEDYHIAVITRDQRIVSELRHSLRDIYVDAVYELTDELLKFDNVAVVYDDISQPSNLDWLYSMEISCIPYIRRSVLGWVEPHLDVNAENILKKFVNRYRPCKLIR